MNHHSFWFGFVVVGGGPKKIDYSFGSYFSWLKVSLLLSVFASLYRLKDEHIKYST